MVDIWQNRHFFDFRGGDEGWANKKKYKKIFWHPASKNSAKARWLKRLGLVPAIRGLIRRYRCSTLFNYNCNLSLFGTFLQKLELLSLPGNRRLLPTPKQTYDFNLSAIILNLVISNPIIDFFVLQIFTIMVCLHSLLPSPLPLLCSQILEKRLNLCPKLSENHFGTLFSRRLPTWIAYQHRPNLLISSKFWPGPLQFFLFFLLGEETSTFPFPFATLRACPVLGWGTTGEAQVLYSFPFNIFIERVLKDCRWFIRHLSSVVLPFCSCGKAHHGATSPELFRSLLGMKHDAPQCRHVGAW